MSAANCSGVLATTNEPVSSIILTRIGPSLTVLVPILIIETVLSVLIALAVAYVRGSLTDRAVMIACTMLLAASGLDIISAFTAVVACINNTGKLRVRHTHARDYKQPNRL